MSEPLYSTSPASRSESIFFDPIPDENWVFPNNPKSQARSGGKGEGYGSFTFLDSSLYTGYSKNYLRDGTGKMEYINGIQHGNPRYILDSPSEYKIQYEKTLKDRLHSIVDCKGYYIGSFKKDMKHGFGKLKLWNSDEEEYYVGYWKGNYLDGYGKHIKNGILVDGGIWKLGILIKSEKIKIKARINIKSPFKQFLVEYEVLNYEPVLCLMELISRKEHIDISSLMIYCSGILLSRGLPLKLSDYRPGDTFDVVVSEVPHFRILAYMHGLFNPITYNEIALHFDAVNEWIKKYMEIEHIKTIQQAWDILDHNSNRTFIDTWVIILYNLIFDSGFRFISDHTLDYIINSILIDYYGYEGNEISIQEIKNCIMKVYYSNSSRIHKTSEKKQDKAPVKIRQHYTPFSFWFDFQYTLDKINMLGVIDLVYVKQIFSLDFIPYIHTPDNFWSLHNISKAFPDKLVGLIYDKKVEGSVSIGYEYFNIIGYASSGVFKGAIVKYFKNGEKIIGHVKKKLLDGLVTIKHESQNFTEYKNPPSSTVLTYNKGIPSLDNSVRIIYKNGDEEEGLFSSKFFESSSYKRRILLNGVKKIGNLRCSGNFEFKTGNMVEGWAQYALDDYDIETFDADFDYKDCVISLEEIAKGKYPHENVYEGKWKNGVLMEGSIEKSGLTIYVKKGTVKKEQEKTVLMRTPSTPFQEKLHEKLHQLDERRKELQKVNERRINVLHLNQSPPLYRKSLSDKYRHLVNKVQSSLKVPFQVLFQQGRTNLSRRKQFMRRLYHDEPYHKQLLEIILRIMKLYYNDRKNIVTSIYERLKELDSKTLRSKDVLPTIMKSLFDDGLLREPEMEEINTIYSPYDRKESLVGLIYAMAPEKLFLGSDLGSKIKDKAFFLDKLTPLIDGVIKEILDTFGNSLPIQVLKPDQVLVEEKQDEDAMVYFQQQKYQQEQRQQQQVQTGKAQVSINVCSWNISYLDIIKSNQQMLSSIKLLEHIAFDSSFILLQETPFDPVQFESFANLLDKTVFISLKSFDRAVVQPYRNVPGMTSQLHGMTIMVNKHNWEIVQRKKPQSYLLKPSVSNIQGIQRATQPVISSMPAKLFLSEPEIMAEQDLNRRAEWYSEDHMKDDKHEPHLFAKLSTLSGLFRSKIYPSFYMIVMNIHVRRTGYNPNYRKRLLRDINKQISLYKEYLERIKGSSFEILIGGDFNLKDDYILTEILNGITALQGGSVIMNPFPLSEPSIDAFLISKCATAAPEYIQPAWQQAQRQLLEGGGGGGGGGLFPRGGHTPFKILLEFPYTGCTSQDLRQHPHVV
jgi:hypothetical protein